MLFIHLINCNSFFVQVFYFDIGENRRGRFLKVRFSVHVLLIRELVAYTFNEIVLFVNYCLVHLTVCLLIWLSID